MAALVLTLFARWARHQQDRAIRIVSMNEYILKRVDQLRADYFVYHYVKQIYFARSADRIAREALQVAIRDSNEKELKPLGICIIGRTTQGKTRLAWEVMQEQLPAWAAHRTMARRHTQIR